MGGAEAEGAIGLRRLADVESGDWVGVAANAASGRGKGLEAVEALARELHVRGLQTRIAWTLAERAELVAASRADRTCRCLVAAGGDGTVSALINEGPGTPIAVLPVGTENLFARQFEFSATPRGLVDRIVQGVVSPLDLGAMDGRKFCLMAGFGFDAEVVSRHHLTRVARTGQPRPTHRGEYVEPVLRASLNYGFPKLRLRVDDVEELEGTTAFVFNLPRYALGLPFAPQAVGDDGLLDLVVFRDGGPFRALRYLWLVLRGLHLRRNGVYHRQIRKIVIESGMRVPVQLDGDPGGFLEAGPDQGRVISVLPSAVEVLVAPTTRASKSRGGGPALASSAGEGRGDARS